MAGRAETAEGAALLGEVGGRLIANLSKGYQQRIGIAQAILHKPSIVILDEPTAVLTPQEEARWKKAVAPVSAEWAKETPDGQKVLQAFRAEVAAYEKSRAAKK